MTSAAIDTERMNQIIDETRKAITFEKLVADSTYDVAKQFMPTDYLKWRMRIINVSPANAKQEAEKVDKSENHIPTFFLFAKNEADQGKIKDTVTAIFDKVGERCIVVDFSSLPFTDALFSKFIESKAKEKYFSTIPNQKSQLELAKKTSQEVLNEWTRKLITTSLYVYSAPNKSVQKTVGANLRKEFKEINGEFFGAGLEEITQNDMFKDLPDIFHESALLDRFHGFIKGWNIPKMKESLKANGWALNTEYFGEIMHYLRDELAYRAVVDQLLQLPKNSATRDTEAIKRICTGYLKLLFPNATDVSKVDVSLFETYCLAPAMEMRRVIKTQLGIIDEGEFGGMTIPEITIKEQYREK